MKFQKFMQVEHNLRKEKRANENLKKKQKIIKIKEKQTDVFLLQRRQKFDKTQK